MNPIPLLLAAAVAGAPPSAAVERAPSGRWTAAHGLAAEAPGPTPEASARAFAARHAAELGLGPRHALALDAAPAPGRAGVVRFQRLLDGWPVLGGGLAFAVDEAGAVVALASADVEPEGTGRFLLSRSAAVDAAAAALGGAGRVMLPASVLQGWAPAGSGLRAAYQVDAEVEGAGPWRAVIDAEDGRVLFLRSRRLNALPQGRVFDLSPVETYVGTPAVATLCPNPGSGFTDCALPGVLRDLADLAPGATTLAGTRFSIYNCRGGNFPASGTTGCDQSLPPLTGGNFDYAPVLTGTASALAGDDFAAVMASYHLARHVDFLKGLEPALDSKRDPTVAAKLDPSPAMPALVNAYSGGQPYTNAFFDPSSATGSVLSGRMVFGQSTQADFAYDASIVYHELTHGVVEAFGGFNAFLDANGAAVEADAANEGTADAMAAAHTGEPRIGTYVGQVLDGAGTLGLRVLGSRLATCRNVPGATFTSQTNPPLTVLYGLDGEPHDDGEIWGGFFWELFDGLRAVPACGGACSAGAAIQYRAMQMTLPSGPGFTMKTYGDNVKAAAASLFPSMPNLQGFVQCAYDRHELAGCDRTLPVYAGERALSYVWVRYASYQAQVTTTGPATLSVCNTGHNGAAVPVTVWVRQGSKVALSTPSVSGTTNAFPATSTSVSTHCSAGAGTVSLPSAGTWYMLLDSATSVVSDANPKAATNFTILANPGNVAARPASPAEAAPCVYAGESGNPPAITPAASSVTAGASETLAASGGSGSGYQWSMYVSRSGGSVTSAGVYTAGPTGGVRDLVRVADGNGASAIATVDVLLPTLTAGKGSGGCGCGQGTGSALGLLALLPLLPRRRRR